jgi:beta-glucosidase
MRSYRSTKLLAAWLVSTTMFAAFACAEEAKKPSTVVPAPRTDQWWQDRQNSFNARVKQGKADLLLIGDSITHGWEGGGKAVWEKYYTKRNAVNLGIGGDQTQHVLWRLDHGNLEGISPKLAVLMIGTNNAASNKPEEIAEGVKAIVAKLQAKLPQMKVLVLAIFPRDADKNGKLRQVNDKTNEIIAKLADNKNVFYLDINAKFLGADGTLSKDIMPDLLHPNEKGYTIWAEAIEPTVAKLMGEK